VLRRARVLDACAASRQLRVDRLEVWDLDHDGALELELGVSHVIQDAVAREVRLLRPDLEPQAPTLAISPGPSGEAAEPERASSFAARFEDADGDGHPDLVVRESRWDDDGFCDAPDGVYRARSGTTGEPCGGVETVERVLRYEPARDRWSRRSPGAQRAR